MRRAALALAFATVALAATSAFARPGGSVGGGYHGSTYRPSIYHRSSSSSGGGDVGAGTVIAVILGLGICAALIVILARRAESRTLVPAAPSPNGLPWFELRAADPAFSQVEFERSVRELYKAVHAPGGLAAAGDRISEAARTELARSSPAERIQIDSVRVIAVGATSITCAIVANHIDAGTTHVTSRWTFSRSGGGWKLDSVVELTAGSMNLVGMGPEIGNDLPTIEDPNAIATFLELRDPAGRLLGWDAFIEHVKATYARVNDAWNRQAPDAVADVATPELVEYLALWIDEHRRQHLDNHHEGATVRHVGLARVVREAKHDLVVVRVYAQGLDYTTTAGTDHVVGGSRTAPRQYTEYWTFVREGTGDFKLASIVQDEMYAG